MRRLRSSTSGEFLSNSCFGRTLIYICFLSDHPLSVYVFSQDKAFQEKGKHHSLENAERNLSTAP